MKITTSPLPIVKRYPLTISRGTAPGSANLRVEVEHDGIVGIGELAPVNIGYGEETAESGARLLEEWGGQLADVAPWEMQRVEERLGHPMAQSPAARCALDVAMYDWLGKRTAMPVYALLGLDPARIAPTSITVGINAPDVIRERIPEILSRLNPKAFKIKLGSPAGIDADKEMFQVVKKAAPPDVPIRVDANGGWSLPPARQMIRWLAERGAEYVEQPLPVEREDEMSALFGDSPLPLFLDESCRTSRDIPRVAGLCHGVNLKLMKAGGIREGLRLIHAARAHGLKVMMGCMSESSLAIAASVHLSPLADYLDLDSHLNLLPDPATGLRWENGRVLPGGLPGLGVEVAR